MFMDGLAFCTRYEWSKVICAGGVLRIDERRRVFLLITDLDNEVSGSANVDYSVQFEISVNSCYCRDLSRWRVMAEVGLRGPRMSYGTASSMFLTLRSRSI